MISTTIILQSLLSRWTPAPHMCRFSHQMAPLSPSRAPSTHCTNAFLDRNIIVILTTMSVWLHWFHAVGWMAGRVSSLQKNLSSEVLAWLSIRSEVQMICIWSSSSEIQNGLPFWCRLTQVDMEKRPLNGCSSVPSISCLNTGLAKIIRTPSRV